MAADASASPLTNGTDEPNKPLELAINLPHNPGLRLHLHLTNLAHSLALFVTSTAVDSHSTPTAMGSFVFAMPDRYHPAQPLSTTLYSAPSSHDFAARMAKVLVRRLKKPCYVGSSVNLSHGMGGGSVDEEIEAFHAIVGVVEDECGKATAG